MATGQNLQFPTDRVLERLANRVVIEADREFGMHQKELAAAVKQRIRLAHALHEGLLQSLTGAALQLEATWHLVDTDPRRGRELVREIQELLLERQRELREWVEAANDGELDPSDACSDLRDALRTLCGRLTRWGPRVELRVSDLERMPTPMHDCVYRLVEEALSNAARHAHANAASVDVHVRQEHVALTIEDDGCGFPSTAPTCATTTSTTLRRSMRGGKGPGG